MKYSKLYPLNIKICYFYSSNIVTNKEESNPTKNKGKYIPAQKKVTASTSPITSLLRIHHNWPPHKFLHFSQEGFWLQCNTIRQIQMITIALEDVQLTNKLTYIDFQNAFDSINNTWLLALMEDLGFPLDVAEIVGNVYMNFTTSLSGSHFGMISLVQISCGTIQGNTPNPYLFILFIEPLLKWLGKNELGCHFNTFPLHMHGHWICRWPCDNYRQHVTHQTTNTQTTKICRMVTHGSQPLKCAITWCRIPLKLTFNHKNITYKSKNLLILIQNKSYAYLGIHIMLSLKWKPQKPITI